MSNFYRFWQFLARRWPRR